MASNKSLYDFPTGSLSINDMSLASGLLSSLGGEFLPNLDGSITEQIALGETSERFW